MTTTSRPANGHGGFTDADWALRFGSQDGIIEDYGDAPGALAMTLLNGSNEAQFTEAYVSLNGYAMHVPAGERVSLPVPTTGSKTYLIGVLYDSALDVPVPTDQGDGTIVQMASEQGPLRLVAYDGVPPLGAGRRFLICYRVTRTIAALTSATVEDRRRWIGTTIEWPWGHGSDAEPGNEGLYPRGTIRIDTVNNRILLRGISADNQLHWVDPLDAGTFNLPLRSGIIARKTDGNPVQYRKYAGWVGLSGAVQRSSGNLSNGNDVPIGDLPAGFRPGYTRRILCKISGSGGQTEIRIDNKGVITMTDPPGTATWLDLSAISFKAEG